MKRLKFMSMLFVAVGVGSCVSNQPATLSSVAVGNATAQITGHPLYETTDAFSFSTATTQYPANEGHHTIPVGQYLLFGVLNTLPEGVTKVRLTNFNSECVPVGSFLPKVNCTTTYALAMTRGGADRIIVGRVETEVGSLYVKDDQLILGIAGYRDYGDNTIVGQVRRAIDRVLEDIKRKQ